jgi:hypothetical protein
LFTTVVADPDDDGRQAMLKTALCLLALAFNAPALAATASSLDQIPGKLKTPEAKAYFDQQMNGAPAPDALGVHLPSGLTAKTIGDLLIPTTDNAPPSLVGAKAWPARADSYLAIVCTGGTGPLGDEPQCGPPRDYDRDPRPLHVYLGLIEMKAGVAPRLIAQSGPIDGAVSWARSGLPTQPQAAEDAKGAPIVPGTFDGFDLAAYRVAPEAPAFGLRASWNEAYSGGGATFVSLYLFVIDGDRLRQVLAAPVFAFVNTAGDWHADQTRDHSIIEAALTLVQSTHGADDHFNLALESRTSHWRRLYRWSKTAGAYQAVGR